MVSSTADDEPMCSTYSRCRRLQRAGARQRQQFGEADDVGERRAQLVGNVLDEIVLQPVGALQGVVLLDQRALDIDAVCDVDEGHHDLAVRQVDDRIASTSAALQLGLAMTSRRSSSKPVTAETKLPATGSRESSASHHGRIAVMCVLCATTSLRQRPQRGEGRVGKADAAIRAEHRDAFGQIVERFALHPDERVVAAFEVHLLGQILEHPGDAAIGLRVGDDAHASARPAGATNAPASRRRGRRRATASFQRRHSGCSASLPSLRRRSSSSALSGALSRKATSRSQSFWNAWLKKRSFSLASKIATAVVRWSSVSAWLLGVLIFLAHRLHGADVDGDAGRPSAPAKSVTVEERAVAGDDGRESGRGRGRSDDGRRSNLAGHGAEEFARIAHSSSALGASTASP